MLAEKNESIKEGIVTLKQLTEDEKEQQRIEGRLRYESELSAATHYGEARYAKLTQKLIENQRTEDLVKAVEDEEFRRQLFKEFGI
ncbi:MAG: hypothetical protein PHW34_10920 [Hespellia sp.]|nr:hypothetical protein [Hespellia sp.]